MIYAVCGRISLLPRLALAGLRKIEDYPSSPVQDLVILLEPLYWPDLTGVVSYRGFIRNEEEREARLESYRRTIAATVKALEADEWKKFHQRLRSDASSWDKNDHLYLLLRVSTWDRRKELKGNISASLWVKTHC